MIRAKGNEMSSGRILGHDISRIRCKGKDIWTSTSPDVEVFSATLSATAGNAYGYTESNRVIDEMYLSDVTAPIFNLLWGTDKATTPTLTKTQKAYTPTELALKKYKYAKVTVDSLIAITNGSNSGSIDSFTLPKDDNRKVSTYLIELNDDTNLKTVCSITTSYALAATYAHAGITKIILTNGNQTLSSLIPKHTGYTSDYGSVLYSSELSSTYAVWKAFDNDATTLGGIANMANPYIGYQFNNEVNIKKVSVDLAYTHGAGTNHTLSFKLQYLNNEEWVDIPNTTITETFVGGSSWTEKQYEWEFNSVKTNAIRLIEYSGSSWAMFIRNMGIYGKS